MHFDSLQGWLAWQETLHPTAIDLGLDRASRVFDALNPRRIKPLTITVAGTNGKGSCVAYLEAIYKAQGYRVGAYTSPHILSYNERIKIDGQPVADSLICEAFERIEAVRHGISLSYFEFGTLAALDIFWRSNLDIQLLEVGLGGRLDAVNIVDPDTAIISSIGIDHVQWLGNSREAIGREKAGIFRAGIPAIVGEPNPPHSLIETAQNKQAELYLFGKDFSYARDAEFWDWSYGEHTLSHLPKPVLAGEHQYRNASAVILAITKMSRYLPVSESAIRFGLQNVQLLGRFQLLEQAGQVPLLIDVGHNPEAVANLATHLRERFPDKRIHAVFSMMKDKDIAGALEIMRPLVSQWFFVPLTNTRAISQEAMREIFLQSRIVNVSFEHSGFIDAFNAAKSQAKPDDLILVFGSFFLVFDCFMNLQES